MTQCDFEKYAIKAEFVNVLSQLLFRERCKHMVYVLFCDVMFCYFILKFSGKIISYFCKHIVDCIHSAIMTTSVIDFPCFGNYNIFFKYVFLES